MLIPDHETAVDFLNYEAIVGTGIELLNDNCAFRPRRTLFPVMADTLGA